jgi:hypothetical protein
MTFAIYFWREGRLAANRSRIEQTTVWKMIYLNVRRTDHNDFKSNESHRPKIDQTTVNALSVTRQHKVLLEYVAQENHTLTFTALSAEQEQAVREDAEERYISYAFLCQSGAQHGNLKVDLRKTHTICLLCQ